MGEFLASGIIGDWMLYHICTCHAHLVELHCG